MATMPLEKRGTPSAMKQPAFSTLTVATGGVPGFVAKAIGSKTLTTNPDIAVGFATTVGSTKRRTVPVTQTVVVPGAEQVALQPAPSPPVPPNPPRPPAAPVPPVPPAPPAPAPAS